MNMDKTSSAFSRHLEKQIKGHVCHCGETLMVAWLEGEYATRCKNNHVNEATRRVKRWRELWEMGIPIDPHIEMVFARQEAQGKIKRKVKPIEELPF